MDITTFDDFLKAFIANGDIKGIDSRRLVPVRVLISPHEVLWQVHVMKGLLYDPILIPTYDNRNRVDTDDLSDEWEEESISYVPSILKCGEYDGHKKKVRTLRKAWRDLLIDLADRKLTEVDKALGGVLVCERRAIPTISGATLSKFLSKIFVEHPDVDVVRLFDKHTTVSWDAMNYPNVLKDLGGHTADNYSLKNLPSGDTQTRLSPECDGTYALFINNNSLKKVAEVFDKAHMPTDTALEFANAKKKLKVMTLSDDTFLRLDYGDKNYTEPSNTYDILMSNYGRPMQGISQAMHMRDQILRSTVKDRVRLVISLRGYDNATAISTKEQLDVILASVNNKVLIEPNRSQLHNFTDAFSGESTLAMKIDDDDLYAYNTIESMVSFHDHLPDFCCSSMLGGSNSVLVSFRETSGERTVLRKDSTGTCENTAVFSSYAIARLKSMTGASMVMDRPKANDSIPMHRFTESVIGLNRYEYWKKFCKFNDAYAGSVFSVLSYEGSSHATGRSSYGSFAVTAGATASEYGIRISDFVDLTNRPSIRPGMEQHRGLDAVIVLDRPEDRIGMYIPTNPGMCTPETGAAQVVDEIVIKDNMVQSFRFARTHHVFVYEEGSQQFVAASVRDIWNRNKDPKSDLSCTMWFRSHCRDIVQGKIR